MSENMTYNKSKFEECIRDIIQKSNCNEHLPSFYEVKINNNNKQSNDFLCFILTEIFHKNPNEIIQLVKKIEKTGNIILGPYTKDVAETKILSANECAFENRQHVSIGIQKGRYNVIKKS